MCPALRGSTVSYAGDAHFPKHSLEYSLNFWSQSKKIGSHVTKIWRACRWDDLVDNVHGGHLGRGRQRPNYKTD